MILLFAGVTARNGLAGDAFGGVSGARLSARSSVLFGRFSVCRALTGSCRANLHGADLE